MILEQWEIIYLLQPSIKQIFFKHKFCKIHWEDCVETLRKLM